MGAEESVWATRGELGARRERERGREREGGEGGERERGGGKHPMGDCISLRGEKKRNIFFRDACMHALVSHHSFLQWKESREGVGGRGGKKERGKEKKCQAALVKIEESYCNRR